MIAINYFNLSLKENDMSKPMCNPGDFCWNELLTSDVNKAKDFYKSLFGWDYQEMNTDGQLYNVIKSAEHDKGKGGLMQIPADKAGKVPSHWITYVFVESVDASLEKATKLGATIKMGATNVGDFGRFGIITDPTGAQIALWQSLKSCD